VRPLEVERSAAEPGDITATGADISRARADLGYEPAVPLEAGLRAEFEWVRAVSRAGVSARSGHA
jgi:nucleoside-diphosphate-sugar epimerase